MQTKTTEQDIELPVSSDMTILAVKQRLHEYLRSVRFVSCLGDLLTA